MVREYIGARYVPKFTGLFDVTQEYEALCVVDNGQGTSYISKIPTPAGTSLTDTTYWAIYGASSGAIINLQNQIDVINTKMGHLDIVSPLDNGAVGDGISDDTVALTGCIKDNVKIDLGGKSYFISAALDLSDHENIEICNGTLIRGIDQLHNNFIGWRCKNIYIHNITSDARGNRSTTTYTWPDNMQAFAIIARSSNVYISACNVSNFKYGICALTANNDQSITPDINRAFNAGLSYNIFRSCGCGYDLYGKNIDIGFNAFFDIDGDGAVIVESEATAFINSGDPFAFAEYDTAAYNVNIHDNYADDVKTFVSCRRGSEHIIINNNIACDFEAAVRGEYSDNIVVKGNYFAKQKNKAWDSTKTRSHQYTHTIEIGPGLVLNNHIFNVCAGIKCYILSGHDGECIISNNILDDILVAGVTYYDGSNNQPITVDSNYFSNIDTTGDGNTDYYFRPYTCDSGKAFVKNNVFNTTRKPIRSFTNTECTLLNNLITTPQTDSVTPITGFTEYSNI